MKEQELRERATCSICGEKIGKCGIPAFYVVAVRHYIVDMQACTRQDGLATYIGSSVIADVMGPQEDLAKQVGDTRTMTVCIDCGAKNPITGGE